MRITRSIQFLAILATAAACSSNGDAAAVPAAAPPPPAAEPAPAPAPVVVAPAPVVVERPSGVSVSLRWDSGPLDRDYRRERAALDARHAREARERADEKADARARRQAAETRALEDRYNRGKKEHARGLPPQ